MTILGPMASQALRLGPRSAIRSTPLRVPTSEGESQ